MYSLRIGRACDCKESVKTFEAYFSKERENEKKDHITFFIRCVVFFSGNFCESFTFFSREKWTPYTNRRSFLLAV